MIFQQKDAVRSGRKTLTQRVDDGGYRIVRNEAGEISSVFKKGRLKWEVGKTYAAVPKRGQKRFGNVRIRSIRYHPLHAMSEEDAVKEGVNSRAEYQVLWQHINGKFKSKHWSANPNVFAIEFEYLGDT